MKSELETLVSLKPSETVSEEAAREINSLLRSGIDAAKNGNRDEAKALLFRVTDIEPGNEMAWLWLASVSEYPEELLTFLQKVLDLNPNNEQALEWEKSTKALLARNLVQYGITAVQENKKESAKRCFLRALETDENNEMAWLWMASISDDAEEKVLHLKKVLAINPENEVANTLLKLLQKDEAQELLQKSKASAVQGNRQEALEMLEQVKQLDAQLEEVWILQAHLSDSFEEKAFCFNQALECNPDNEAAKFGLASLQSILEAVNGSTPAEVQTELEEPAAANEDVLVEDSEELMEERFSAESEEMESSPNTFEDTLEDTLGTIQTDEKEETEAFAPVFPPEADEANGAPEADEAAEVDAAEELYFSSQFASHEETAEIPEPAPEFEAISHAASTDSADQAEQENAELHSDEFVESAVFSGNGFGSHSFEHAEDHSHFDSINDEEIGFETLDFSQPTQEPMQEPAQEEASFESDEEMASAPESSEPASSFEEIKAETIYFGQPEKEEAEQAASFEESREEESAENAESAKNGSNESFANGVEEEGFAAAEDLNENFAESFEEEITEETSPSFSGFASEPAEEIMAEQTSPLAQGSECPFCATENNINDEVCGGCQAVLGLHNMDMLLSRQEVDHEQLSDAVERMEADLGSDDTFSAEEYFNLGLACLNLKKMDSGLKYLQKSYILNPTNSFLKAQIDELAKRMGKDDGDQEDQGDARVGTKTIMVVDDSATIRKLVSAKLEKHGHKVVMAVDGMDALAKLEEAVPDLILLDITMPRLDGYQVCKLIRANDNTRFVPVVLISGKDGFFDKVRGKMCGSTTYITKPFGPEMLLRTVESYFE